MEGFWSGSLAKFMGIPYATPPTGPLRWQPPQPAKCWKEPVFYATNYSSICPQFGSGAFSPVVQSEDCLYLNVYVSKFGSPGLKPVLFWIHGGSLVVGSAYSYNVDLLAEKLDVVIVSINYRLNVFGFLALDELNSNDERKVSGNYGILDQLLALKWVQNNIAAFGGDPKLVTLIGQSSGGTSIFALLSSPASQGLFSRAISLSGSANITMDLKTASIQNRQFLTLSNCSNLNPTDTLSCIYSLNTTTTLQSTPPGYNFLPLGYPFPDNKAVGMNYPGVVIVDGVTVTLPFKEAIKRALIDVPLIIQGMSHELALFSPYSFRNETTAAFKSLIYNGIAKGFGPLAGSIITDIYFNKADNDYIFYKLLSDLGLQCASSYLAISSNKNYRSPIYISFVDTPPSTPYYSPFNQLSVNLPFHMWDYMAGAGDWNIFCYPGCTQCCNWQPQAADQALGDTLRRMWYQFAVTGKLVDCKRYNDVPGFPLDLNWCHPKAEGLENAVNARKIECDALWRVGFDDKEWWCD
uniref:Carboxylic ester hydrolase n=1 Tax=Arcella intermedia TaxID=1963864 RepID=A0A6B2L1H4_9EUKA